ncbi:MAG: lipid kinase [Geminicoccaceae bacterium]
MTEATAQPPRSVVLVLNAKAGRADGLADDVAARLEVKGVDMVASCDALAHDWPATLATRPADAIVVAGGDGTVNAALPDLVAANLPFGVLPLGTANDFARTLGIPDDLDAAIDIVAEGHLRAVDLARANDHYFLNAANIGLATEVTERLQRASLKRRAGRFSYAVASAQMLSRARPFRAWLKTADGEISVRTLQITVGNGRFYGGGAIIEDSATIDDGRLDLYSLELGSAWPLLALAPWLWRGRHGRFDGVRTLHGDAFAIRTRRPRTVTLDGEPLTRTPLLCQVLPKALQVFAPRA